MKKDNKDIQVRKTAKKIYDMHFKDEDGVNNYYLDEFMGEYAVLTFPLLKDTFETIWNLQEDTKQTYGDADYDITKYETSYTKPDEWGKNPFKNFPGYENEPNIYNWGGQTYTMQTLVYKNFVSCAPDTEFLIQKTSNDKWHLRIVYDKTDYRKGNTHVDRPNLKWYKDRDFYLDYIEQYHVGPLGGSYGDLRDRGYIVSFEKGWDTVGMDLSKDTELEDLVGRQIMTTDGRGLMRNWHYYKSIMLSLTAAVIELKEQYEETDH